MSLILNQFIMIQTSTDLATPGPVPEQHQRIREYMTTPEFILAAAVLIFGALVIALLFFFLRRRNLTADDILRTISVTLIIIGSLFCMAAGFDNSQIAPIIGLFGTIIGYIVGKKTSEPSKTPETNSSADEDKAARND